MKKQSHVLTGTLLMSVIWAVPTFAQDYDLVINNGRVMDPETLYDDIANVGIKDGRIVAISQGCTYGYRDGGCHRPNRGTGLHRHALPLSNAGRLFPRVARRVDQQHRFRDGLCGILYGGMVRSACRRDRGQLWLRGQPRICPRDGDRRGRRRLHERRPPFRFGQPGRKRAGAKRARPWNRATRFSKSLTRACRLAPPASAAPWAT